MEKDKPTTVGDRVRLVIDKEYQGNHREASRRLGVSQPSVWRVVNNERPPSIKLLLALTEHAHVDLNWLLTGEGIEYGRATLGLPIADRLLPGPPKEHAESLTERYAIIGGHLSGDTAYVVEPPVPGIDMDSADRLVLDANPIRWRNNVRTIDGRLCAVVRKVAGANNVELRRVACVFDDSGRHLELHAYRNARREHPGDNPIEQQTGNDQADALFSEKAGKMFRGMELRNVSHDASPGGAAFDPDYDVVELDDIVGVAVLFFRDLLVGTDTGRPQT